MKAYSGVPLVERARKPRQIGLTVIHDAGVGLAMQRDALSVIGEYVDFAKIPVGFSRLLDLDLLREKIATYSMFGVTAYPGGQLLEYAVAMGCVEEFMRATVAAGYRCIEVSDNLVSIAPDAKTRLVREAIEVWNLQVFAEVGKKMKETSASELARDARRCLDAGATKVIVEAAELLRAKIGPAERIAQVLAVGSLHIGDVIVELPGYWLPHAECSDQLAFARQLVDAFGPDVNVANVDADKLLLLEAIRRNIGTNAGETPVTR